MMRRWKFCTLTALLVMAFPVLAASLDDVGRTVGGVNAPGTGDGRVDSMIRKAEEAAKQAEEAARKAEEAEKLANEAAQTLQQNQFVVQGYSWMAESCGRIKNAQALLNCEGANLYYMQYQEAFNSEDNKQQAVGLYKRHKNNADKAIRLYKKANK